MTRAVLLDVDGTLLDTLAGLREVWRAWAAKMGLDAEVVHATALRTRPTETFAEVAPGADPAACLALLHELEDAEAREGDYAAFEGAAQLLAALPADGWALVTSNYEHRVRIRFARLGLPMPSVVVDAAAVRRGKPNPESYLLAATRLGCAPADCLVLEDGASGVEAGRAAGMTVWAVGTDDDLGADERFATLADAVPAVLRWAAA